MLPSSAELLELGRAAGLDAVGVTNAEPFAAARQDLEERKAQGLHGGMAFTYRNPERSTSPARAVRNARSLVVGARAYWRSAAPSDSEQPLGSVARYSWTDHYAPLREALGVIADRLREGGWQARVVADDNALVDRAAAHRAGLGWYGKNANLLFPGQGSWFVLGTVVTDAELDATASEPVADGCGTCTRCIDGCPTGAIVAPGVVDARRCLAWLVQAEGDFPLEYREALGDRIYGCDECQEVCPPNRLSVRRRTESDTSGSETGKVPVLDMLEASEKELLEQYGRWYIPKREPRYLRRNALVVLGNIGDPQDHRTVDVLRRCLRDPDPMIRRHAEWAAQRLEART